MTHVSFTRRTGSVSPVNRHAPGEINLLDLKKADAYQVQQKTEATLRILRGENLEALSLEYGVTVGRLLLWKEVFLAHGKNGLHNCAEAEDSEIERLKNEIEWQRTKNEELRRELRRTGCIPLV